MDKEVVSLHVAVGLDWMTFKCPSQPKGFCDSPNSDSLSLDISIGWCEYSLNVHPNDPLAIGTTFLFLFMHLVSLGAFYQFFNKICVSLILEIGCQNWEKEFSIACTASRKKPFSPQHLHIGGEIEKSLWETAAFIF